MRKSLPPARHVTFGICLGARDVGLALASRERLVWHHVLNLRKIQSSEARERRFVQIVEKMIDVHGATRVAVVDAHGRIARLPAVQAQRQWVQAIAQRRGIDQSTYSPDVVRKSMVRTGRPTNRAVAMTLAARFPELLPMAARPLVKLADGVSPQFAQRLDNIRSPRERYWRRMFLALAGALHDLDDQLKQRLSPR